MSTFYPQILNLINAHTPGNEEGWFSHQFKIPKNKKTADIESINTNITTIVCLCPLLCQEGKQDDDFCKKVKNDSAEKCLCDFDGDAAHIYLSDISSRPPTAKHYIIAFIEGTKINEDMIVQRLYNTVEWLEIQNERPHFYVYYYGDTQLTRRFSTLREHLEKKLKQRIGGYLEKEDILKNGNFDRKYNELTINRKHNQLCFNPEIKS